MNNLNKEIIINYLTTYVTKTDYIKKLFPKDELYYLKLLEENRKREQEENFINSLPKPKRYNFFDDEFSKNLFKNWDYLNSTEKEDNKNLHTKEKDDLICSIYEWISLFDNRFLLDKRLFEVDTYKDLARLEINSLKMNKFRDEVIFRAYQNQDQLALEVFSKNIARYKVGYSKKYEKIRVVDSSEGIKFIGYKLLKSGTLRDYLQYGYLDLTKYSRTTNTKNTIILGYSQKSEGLVTLDLSTYEKDIYLLSEDKKIIKEMKESLQIQKKYFNKPISFKQNGRDICVHLISDMNAIKEENNKTYYYGKEINKLSLDYFIDFPLN